jgi:hypothetical protein
MPLRLMHPWHLHGGHSVVIKAARSSVAKMARSGSQLCPESRETRMVIKGGSAGGPASSASLMKGAPVPGVDADSHLHLTRHCNRLWNGHSIDVRTCPDNRCMLVLLSVLSAYPRVRGYEACLCSPFILPGFITHSSSTG